MPWTESSPRPFVGLQVSIKGVLDTILTQACTSVSNALSNLLQYEKDPFTLNEFLIQWCNKLKYDRFVKAVDEAFESSHNTAANFTGLKEEIYHTLRSWYRNTHAISPQASKSSHPLNS
jgi:hypothetical protein